MSPLIPDLDIWMKVLTRIGPDPQVVQEFVPYVKSRRIFLMGWIRQGLLVRARDKRQQDRLTWILSGFPDIPVLSPDYIQAASLVTEHRMIQPIDPWRALMWAVTSRIDGEIWSRNLSWAPLVKLGCPLRNGVS